MVKTLRPSPESAVTCCDVIEAAGTQSSSGFCNNIASSSSAQRHARFDPELLTQQGPDPRTRAGLRPDDPSDRAPASARPTSARETPTHRRALRARRRAPRARPTPAALRPAPRSRSTATRRDEPPRRARTPRTANSPNGGPRHNCNAQSNNSTVPDGSPRRLQCLRVDHQPFETRRIRRVRIDVHHVARRARHDHVVRTRSEQGTQPVHELLHRARRTRRAVRRPTARRSVDRPTPRRSRRPATRPGPAGAAGSPARAHVRPRRAHGRHAPPPRLRPHGRAGQDRGSDSPRASPRPTRRLRERSPVHVSTRSPSPANPSTCRAVRRAPRQPTCLGEAARDQCGARVVAETEAVARARPRSPARS